PTGLNLTYEYDDAGNLKRIKKTGGALIYQVMSMSDNGKVLSATYGNGSTSSYKYFVNHGFPEFFKVNNGSDDIFHIKYQPYVSQRSIKSRENVLTGAKEEFEYQHERLAEITYSNTIYLEEEKIKAEDVEILYYDDGTRKTRGFIDADNTLEKYTNGPAGHWHAVHSIENAKNDVGNHFYQAYEFNGHNKISKIVQTDELGVEKYRLELHYNPAGQRIKTELFKDGASSPEITKFFIGNNVEKEIYDSGNERILEYIYGPTGMVAVNITENGAQPILYYVHTDYPGFYNVALQMGNGDMVEEYSYDAWGRRRDPVTYGYIDSFSGLISRGYTNHEHLDKFLLINMNGRVYDPVLGAFLSPDPYIQAPTNTQNYNRYAYALNNPLIYTDPSGEFFHLIIGAVIGGIINWATHGADFTWEGLGYFGVGALAGGLSAGVGMGVTASLSGASLGLDLLGHLKEYLQFYRLVIQVALLAEQ
ncbi:MAG: hypothetical protein HC905_30910, partial [Bacteroidales bacterium]|nr:hypothetical protein [Bacteroidales bacterium]